MTGANVTGICRSGANARTWPGSSGATAGARLASGCRLRFAEWDWLPTGVATESSDACFYIFPPPPGFGLARHSSYVVPDQEALPKCMKPSLQLANPQNLTTPSARLPDRYRTTGMHPPRDHGSSTCPRSATRLFCHTEESDAVASDPSPHDPEPTTKDSASSVKRQPAYDHHWRERIEHARSAREHGRKAHRHGSHRLSTDSSAFDLSHDVLSKERRSAHSPFYDALHASWYERRNMIRAYEAKNHCRLVVMIDSLRPDSVTAFEETLYDADPKDDLHVMLVTPGGDGETALRLVQQAQSRCAELTAVVPDQAKSAGTLFVLGADPHLYGADQRPRPRGSATCPSQRAVGRSEGSYRRGGACGEACSEQSGDIPAARVTTERPKLADGTTSARCARSRRRPATGGAILRFRSQRCGGSKAGNEPARPPHWRHAEPSRTHLSRVHEGIRSPSANCETD